MKTRRLLGSLATVAVAAGFLPAVLPGVAGAATAACTAPTNLAPSNDYRVVDPTVIKDVSFSWNAVPGAPSYDVQVSLDEDFASNILATYTTTATSYDVQVGDLINRSFFWRVRVTGARCWSDDGTPTAASVTKGWTGPTSTPVPITNGGPGGCDANGSIPLSQVRFCWSPVVEAAYYRLSIIDTTDGTTARCYTNQTELTPNYLFDPSVDQDAILNGAERITQARCFNTVYLVDGDSYQWQVTAFDQGSSLTAQGAPYGKDVVVLGSQPAFAPKDAPPTGAVTVSEVRPRSGPAAGGFRVDVTGSGFEVGHMSVAFAGATVDADHVTVDSPTHLHFTAPPKLSDGTTDVIVTNDDLKESSVATLFSPFSVGSTIDSFTNTEEGDPSAFIDLTIAPSTVTTGAAPAPANVKATAPAADGSVTRTVGTGALVSGKDCTAVDTTRTNDCATTPVITWDPVAQASEYRVTFFVNTVGGPGFTLRSYDTHSTSLATRDLLLPDQAGNGYRVTVQSCKATSCSGGTSTPISFRTRSTPVALTYPAQGATSATANIVLTWQDYLATAGTSEEAGRYHVDVASDCDFSTIVTSGDVDFARYASTNFLYPDGTYYWRVQAIDASGTPLAFGNGPNRDASNAGTDCGSTAHFTVAAAPATTTPGGTTTTTPGGTTTTTGGGVIAGASQALSVHYGQPVIGITAAALQLVEESTGRIVPAAFTPSADGGSLSPAAADLIPGERYLLKVVGRVTDTKGNVLAQPTIPVYRAPTTLDAPGVFVKLGGAWQSRKAKGSLNGIAVVTTSHKRPSATVRFRSSSVSVGYCKGPLNGYLAVYVDGKLKKTVSTYSPFSQCGLPTSGKAPHYTVGNLDSTKQHTITVVETGKKGTRKGVSAAIDWFKIV